MCDTGLTSFPHHMRIQCWMFPGSLNQAVVIPAGKFNLKQVKDAGGRAFYVTEFMMFAVFAEAGKKKRYEKVVTDHP